MTTAPFYRIDKFIVPEAARQAFIDAVSSTDAFMRDQPGFVRHDVLEQIGGPGEFNFVTIAEWESDAVIPAVTAAIARLQAERGFDRNAFLATHGIKADIANYRVL